MDNQLTKEQKVLLNLTALSISSEPERLVLSTESMSGVDWETVIKESIAQAVTLACFDSLKYYSGVVPKHLYDFWMRGSMGILNHNSTVVNAQKNMVSIMGDDDYVILKGLASASYYKKPSLRALGDVDFLINPTNRSMLEDRYVLNGYTLSQADHPSHVVFRKDKEHLEMHFEVAGIPYREVGQRVRTLLKDTLTTRIKRSYDGHEYYAPSDYEHGIILLLHMQHHMLAEGFGLRHLSDWATYVEATHDRPSWDRLILDLKGIGLYTYAMAMTETCVKYLGITQPKWLLESTDDTLIDDIIKDIFDGGNFGVKDKDRQDSAVLISDRGKDGVKHSAVYNLLHALHYSIIRQHPIVKKVWILYPFIYIYKAIRYAFLTLIGKRPNLMRLLPEANIRKSTYEKLAIFETKI